MPPNRHWRAATQSMRGWTRFVLILFAASACTTWNSHAVETGTAQTAPLKGHFRVTVRDGSSVDLKDVMISDDSISGLSDTREGTATNRAFGEPVAVPRSDVIAFKRLSFSASRTSFALVGTAVGGIVVFVALFAAAMSQSGY